MSAATSLTELQHGWVEFARAGTPRSLDGSPWSGYDNGDPRLTVIADTTEAGPVQPGPLTEMINSMRRKSREASPDVREGR